MISDNVLQMVPANVRARRLRVLFDRYTVVMAGWIAATLDLAEELWAARQEHPSNVAFSIWLAENELDILSHQDRAALIGLGQHPKLSAEICAETESRSLQLIWEIMKPRLTSTSKTTIEGEQSENLPEPPTIAGESANPASEKEPSLVDEVSQPEPEKVSKQTLAKAAVGSFPKSDLVLGHVLNKTTRTLLGQITKNKKNGGSIWLLLIQAIESGAYGQPCKADVSKPSLRLILPWASVSFAQRFDLTKTKDQKIVSDEILPVVIANRDVLTENPERLSALIYEAANAPQREAAKRRHVEAVAQLPTSEREVMAFGETLWPRPSNDHAYAFTYDELCHAVWFSQMLFGSYSVEWKPLSKTMQTAHLIKFVEPMLKAPGWAVAVRDIFNAYAKCPHGECRFPSPPINFRIT